MHALSVPTWLIHVSSVLEWIIAIWLVWTYSVTSRNPSWRFLSFAMLPALIGAMCACTWHFFDNAPQLEWLVTLQASMTLIGNTALCGAAWWIWRQSPTQTASPGDHLRQSPPLSSADLDDL